MCLLSLGEISQHQEVSVASLFQCWWRLELSSSMWQWPALEA